MTADEVISRRTHLNQQISEPLEELQKAMLHNNYTKLIEFRKKLLIFMT